MNHIAVKFTFARGVAPGESAISCYGQDIDYPSVAVTVWAATELEAMTRALGLLHVRRLERAAGLEKGTLEKAIEEKAQS